MRQRAVHAIATATVAAILGIATQGAAQAQGKITAGTLTCTAPGGVTLTLVSKKSYDCIYQPASGRAMTAYTATVTRIGLDIGVTGKTTMVWSVLSAVPTLAPGMLRGDYVGPAADASIGVGAGAKILVGGSKSSVTLQPLSVQGQTGVNLAVGVAEMKLR